MDTANGSDEHGECVEKWEQRFKNGKCTVCGDDATEFGVTYFCGSCDGDSPYTGYR